MGKTKNLLENEREQIVRLRKRSKTFTEIASIVSRSETTCKQAWHKFVLRSTKKRRNGSPDSSIERKGWFS